MIEHRECIIYEIIGRKVGSTVQGEYRPKQQLTEGETYNILQVIPPNTLTVRECWETECEWQMRYGYKVENEGRWKYVYHARVTQQDSDWIETVRHDAQRRRVSNMDWQSVADKASIRQNDPEWKKKQHKECPHCGMMVNPGNYSRHIVPCKAGTRRVKKVK